VGAGVWVGWLGWSLWKGRDIVVHVGKVVFVVKLRWEDVVVVIVGEDVSVRVSPGKFGQGAPAGMACCLLLPELNPA
ncbi:MAG: hypothetical protein ACKPKO_49340, partial [Candidatus Fonsibacter sp.]